MRILHVYKDVYPPVLGGIERHIDSIRRALPDFRHDVLVCSRQRTSQERPTATGTDHLVAEFGRVLSTPLAPGFPSRLRQLAPGAVVHLHMPNPLAELSVLGLDSSIPVVATYHADVYRQRHLMPLYRPLLVRCLRRAQAVLTASRALRDASPVLRRAAVPVQVVPFGIDLAQWTAEPEAAAVTALRELYGERHVLSVGRLVSYKGLNWLIEAARDIPWPVVIVGDGPERNRLERLVQERALSARVHLVGAVDDQRLAAHFAAAEAFVLPSVNRAEAFGITLLEAQAVGLPVVATDVSTGTVEAFETGVTGLLVQPRDARGIADAIRWLAADESRRRAMGEAGRRRVAQRNSLAGLGRRLEQVYRQASALR